MPKKKKRFTLPGTNKKTVAPSPVKPTPAPGPVTLTTENAPLWTCKFLEEIRNELRVMNKYLEKATANV